MHGSDCACDCERPFQCKITFIIQKGHLIMHPKFHSGEKDFKCDQCKKAFIHKCHLIVHRNTHIGEKEFKCVSITKG